MVFPYYKRLSPARKAIYRQSDRLDEVPLPEAAGLQPLARAVGDALASERRADTRAACQALVDALSVRLGIRAPRVEVLAARPSRDWGELHGLYQRPVAGRGRATLTVWMRTAQRRQVVSFRTFLRTLLHEVLHHLDYEFFRLADSYHTEGFFKRESSLMRQLLEPAGSSSMGRGRMTSSRQP